MYRLLHIIEIKKKWLALANVFNFLKQDKAST